MGTHPIFESDFDCLTDFSKFPLVFFEIGPSKENEMFRRSRGFTTTVFILCSIVMFGYGLYMYDLQSLKLTEAESKDKRLERLEHSQGSELKQLKNSKNELEEKLQKEKHEHQQKTLTLKLETEQRDAREADLREDGGKLNTVTKEKNDCEEQLNAKDEELGK